MLRNTAYLLCGDWHLAEDLTQTVFIKLYRAWRRIERHDTMDQFARKVLLRTYLDERRRPWRREFPTEPDTAELEVAELGDDPETPCGAGAAFLGGHVGGTGRRDPRLLARNGQEPDLTRSGQPAQTVGRWGRWIR